MKTFTIENETNNIIAHATQREAAAVPNAESFSSAAELAELAANWTAPRLVEIWNSIPGNTPVKKFTDRKTAATRIWKAIQDLGDSIPSEDAAEAEALVGEIPEENVVAEPMQTEPATDATPRDEAPASESEQVQSEASANEPDADVREQTPDIALGLAKATKKATREKKTHTGEPKTKSTREGSKTETVLTLMKREGGVTLKGIMEATSWQSHSVRGFISGTLGKKMGLTVVSTKAESGERTYTLAS